MRKSRFLVWLTTLALAACGGGGNEAGSSFASSASSSSGAAAAATVASIVVQSSLASIPSDNSVSTTISAIVRDANNVAISGVTVVPSASSGSLSPLTTANGAGTNVTDATGTVKYTLSTPGDSSNRVITVRVAAGTISGQTTVNVSTSAVTVLLLSDSATIQSNNSTIATLSAYVRDANNNFIAGVPVTLTSDTGALTPVVTTTGVAALTTDANGLARATLSTPGDQKNRTITVTARVGTTSSVATVDVVGTTLTLSGSTNFILGQSQTWTATLQDSGKQGIANKALTITAPANATVTPTTGVTNNLGKVDFTITANTGGSGSIGVAALGLTASQTIAVNSDVVTFLAPAAGTLIPLKTAQVFTAEWRKNGVLQSGQPMTFATTRGCIVPSGTPAGTTCTGMPSTATVTTNGSGQASAYLLSDNAGSANVTATVTGGTVASYAAQFVAVTPNTIDVQASKFTIGPSEQSTITAVVRDAQNNLVANSTIAFTVSDVTGGTISTATAVTDALGRAQTVFTASTVPSANSGVKITATVQSAPSITKTVSLTVARTQLFISIGTGNTLFEPNSAQYRKEYVVQVTDANGAGVSNVALTMSVLSEYFMKGCRSNRGGAAAGICPPAFPGTTTTPFWTTIITAVCPDEDLNRNGVLDPGEDYNGSARIEAGNIVSVTPASSTTDSNGFVTVNIYYPQEYGEYLQVTLQAQAQVQGTAFAASSTFTLPIAATAMSNTSGVPPGPTSPFGFGTLCTDTN